MVKGRFVITAARRIDPYGRQTQEPPSMDAGGSWGTWVWFALGIRDVWRFGPSIQPVIVDIYWYVVSANDPVSLPLTDPVGDAMVERGSRYFVRSLDVFDLAQLQRMAQQEVGTVPVSFDGRDQERINKLFYIRDPDGD